MSEVLAGEGHLELDAMYRRVDQARRSMAELDAGRTQLIEEKGRLIMAMGEAEEYLSRKDDVSRVLEDAQERIQAHSKELFEQLLTQLLHDVLEHNNDQIVLQTGVQRNRSTLEFLCRSPSGFLESIYEDKGGSIQNIVSVGLRFLVLTRTRNRRILFLDEPDCWIRPANIPAFIHVVETLARKVGVQVVYISHHNTREIAPEAQQIHLDDNEGVVETDVRAGSEHKPHDAGIGDEQGVAALSEGVGWRYIRLVNFKSHTNTMIPLSSGLNVISGRGDIGKSHVRRAVEALLHNRGSDSLVQHHQKKAVVEIGLEDGMVLQWTYRKRGRRKSIYTLTDANNRVVQSWEDGKQVPDWLHEYLGMAPVNELDIHTSDQQQPNFLIDRATSPYMRARALSLGEEARRIQMMITLHGEKCQQYRRELNHNERNLRRVKNRLAAYRDNDFCRDKIEHCAGILADAGERNEQLQKLFALYTRLSSLQRREHVLTRQAPPAKVEAPPLHDLDGLARTGRHLARLARRRALLEQAPTPVVHPQLQPLDGLWQKLARVQRCQRRADVLAAVRGRGPVATPSLHALASLQALGQRLTALSRRKACLEAPVAELSGQHERLRPESVKANAWRSAERLVALGQKLGELTHQHKHTEQRLATQQRALAEAETEKERVMRALGYCPVCNTRDLNGAHHHD